jgi:hypothetical protein
VTPDFVPPIFATNRPSQGESVADAVNNLLEAVHSTYDEQPELLLATAYINPQGWVLIADEVERVERVRLLLGAVPDEGQRRKIEAGERIVFEPVAEHHLGEMVVERDLLGFTLESDAHAKRLIRWLESKDEDGQPRVEVRRLTTAFLHGKAFIVDHPTRPAVLSGSSNLTLAGLKWNRELNIGYPKDVRADLVLGWFEEQWVEAEPFDLAAVYEERWSPHEPETVFFRMLYELYGANPIDQIVETESQTTEFQKDGIARARRILGELGGVLVCDEVGLGKTFIAGDIIREFSKRNRQKVLVVVPAALKNSTWEPFLRQQDLISNRVEVVTYDELRLGTHRAVHESVLDDYALVVVDEAHNLRNAATQRAEALLRIVRSENPTQVLLLTATPVNNSLRDLSSLLGYFLRNDSVFAPIGIPSVKGYIREAENREPDTLSPEHLFDLMDKVAVRRTRRFIKTHYRNDTIINNRGECVQIEFPASEVERLDYQLDDGADELVDAVVAALQVRTEEDLVLRSDRGSVEGRLTMARYAPSFYLKTGDDEQRGWQLANAGLLRSTLLKRMESSTTALIDTLELLLRSQMAFVRALDEGYVLRGEALRGFLETEKEDVKEFFDKVADLYSEKEQVSHSSNYDIDLLRCDVEHDIKIITHLYNWAKLRRIGGPDDKLDVLVERLQEIAAGAERPTADELTESEKRKVVIFSTYSATVKQVHEDLSKAIESADPDSPLLAYKGRLAPYIIGAAGSMTQTARAEVIANFCPRTAGELRDNGEPASDDLYDIVITTDVLAEGVNLQQAGHMVNYDLPWNPMKLVQRHGRIDRIGSPHKRIQIDCFFPAENLDSLLNLEETLQRKIAYANAAVGAGQVLPGQQADPAIEILHHDARQQIEELRAENPILFETGGGTEALSGEEYRRRLSLKLKSTQGADPILYLPHGAGSGFTSPKIRQTGYIFCAKIGDHPTPWFRFVAADPNHWDPLYVNEKPWIDNDTLTCLIAADPGTTEPAPRHIDDLALQNVFAAWEHAQKHIYEGWDYLTDQANLDPQLEKPVREAISLIEESRSFSDDRKDRYKATLNGSWDSDIVRDLRAIVRDETTDEEKVDKIRDFIKENGLQPQKRPTPLPPVRKEDIRVICWMAVGPPDA